MLRNTLILPESDARLAARLLNDAVHRLDIVLMLIIGKGADVEQIVAWADQLCDKTQTADGNLRRVVWIRDTSTQIIRQSLAELIGDGPLPSVAVLNFFDKLKATLSPNHKITPLTLELAFVKGHQS